MTHRKTHWCKSESSDRDDADCEDVVEEPHLSDGKLW